MLINLNQQTIILLLSLNFILNTRLSIAQSEDEVAPYPKVNIVSPTASAIAKHVDFPVNLHTGVPDINIPIYTVQEGPLQLPISLSYHASGLKIMEPGSWVGAGWSLNAGGVISRNIKQLPDETVGPDQYSFFSNGGFSNYYLDGGGLPNYFNDTHPRADYQAFATGRKDGEPDIFTFSFGGHGGKFYFREDLTPVLIPEGDMKIKPILKSGSNTQGTYDYIQGFKITTPDGVKYYFGVTSQLNDVDPIEKSTLYTASSGIPYSDVISSWYLYKVQSADNEFEINISYRKEDYGYFTIGTKTNSSGYGELVSHKNLISGVAIQQIQFSNGSVDFVANNLRQDLSRNSISPLDDQNISAKSLDSIKISSNQSQYCRSYKFTYDYFVDDSTQELPYVISQTGGSSSYSTDRKRLKLNTIQGFACDNNASTPPYVFYYYDEELVPRRLSFGQDHWGFNNGAETNTTLLPGVSTDNGGSYSNGDKRESKWPEMRAGALRLMQYPTGGGTEYIYEPNSVTTVNNCTFEQSSTQSIAVISAGMGGPDAGFGTPYTLEVETPSAFYYDIAISGNGSGRLYIDNSLVAEVNSSTPSSDDYVFLNSGTYIIKAYANEDTGSGNGVIAHLYPASASCDPPQEKMIGGLRIKKINKFGTKDSPNVSRVYEYDHGSLYSIPTYIFKFKHDVLKGAATNPAENGCAFHDASNTYVTWAYSPVSVHPMQSMQGYHIGYKEVKEISPDGGYTVYEFKGNVKLPGNWITLEDVCVRKINVNDCTPSDPIYPSPPLAYDFERGHLKSKKIFDTDDRKLKETIYSEQYTENTVGVFGVTTAIFPTTGTVLPTHYEVQSGKLDWTKQLEKVFDENGNSIDHESVTYFNSSYHRMPTKTTQTSQNGLAETEHLYVRDLTECNYECPSCATDYVDAVETLTSEYNTKDNNCTIGVCSPSDFLGWPHPNDPCGWIENCRLASWIDYQYRLNQARVTYTNCINTCKQNNTCVTDGINASTNDNVKSLYILEQANQLHSIETTFWKENILQKSAFFDYRTGSEPTKVYLKNIYTTELPNPVNTFNIASIVSGAIERDANYSEDPYTTYLHSDGQIVELKNRKGELTSYIWGFNNTVPIVKAAGIEYSTLITAYTNSPATIRDDSSLSNAEITTYAYDPVVGITSVTDANGKTVEYIYDKLGRLIQIKNHDGEVIEQFQYQYYNE